MLSKIDQQSLVYNQGPRQERKQRLQQIHRAIECLSHQSKNKALLTHSVYSADSALLNLEVIVPAGYNTNTNTNSKNSYNKNTAFFRNNFISNNIDSSCNTSTTMLSPRQPMRLPTTTPTNSPSRGNHKNLSQSPSIREENLLEEKHRNKESSVEHDEVHNEIPCLFPLFSPTSLSCKLYDMNTSMPLFLRQKQHLQQSQRRKFPPIIANRFTEAQRDRTLRHHNLIQPTASQERTHLASLRLDRQIEYPRNSSSCLSLLTLPEEADDDCLSLLTSPEEVEDDCDVSQGTKSLCHNDEPNYNEEIVNSSELVSEAVYPEKDCRRPRTLSTTTSTTSASSSYYDYCSNRSTTSSTRSNEEDGLSEVSPTTTLFVPGEGRKESGYVKTSNSKLNECEGSNIDAIEITTSTSSISATASNMSNCAMPTYCRPCEMETHSPSHRFVICADTQFGITSNNKNWDAEANYSIAAIDLINSMNPRPAFVCICGDLVDMEYSFEKKKGSKSMFTSTLFDERKNGIASREVCDAIQDEQNEDFKNIWSSLHPDIALVCLCGNHDVGNRPTPRSISRFRASYGDEYLAFWTNGTYNIVLNNVLFVDPSGAKRIFNTQLRWLEDRLKYAQDHQAKQIYVFAHHPWFLYDEDEDPESLTGFSPYPKEWQTNATSSSSCDTFPDSYFSMPKRFRGHALELFRTYGVNACFSGHFHQNLVSRTSWGCDMIITAPLSVVFESTGKKQDHKTSFQCDNSSTTTEEEQYFPRRRKMTYESEEAMLNSNGFIIDSGELFISKDTVKEQTIQESNRRGVRVVDVKVSTSMMSNFSHWFVPL